jgi:signal transduction histidine kinase
VHVTVGHSLYDVLSGERQSVVQAYMKQVLEGETVRYERVIPFEGREQTFSVSLIPEKSLNGEVESVLCIGTDITEHKRIENELRRAKDEADAANQAKSAFLANMSHEIRTPLGAVLGFAELMISADMTPSEKAASVEAIKRNGWMLSNIINDILDLSKVEAGRLELDCVDISVDELVEDARGYLDREAMEKGLRLNWALEGPVPGRIHTDPLRVRQILLNIIGNAIKFTEKGEVEVKIKMIPAPSSDRMLMAFIIKDTGLGVSPQQALRLFKPFSQADASMTRKFGGTGLGLVLSRRLARGLGGDVVLTSSVLGEGSTFMVTIDPGSEKHQWSSDADPSLAHDTATRQRLGNLRVLLVEDSPDIQSLVKRLLRVNGASVQVASNGREGLEKALNSEFDAILMDLQMPEMDGFEATRQLRERGYTKPIIALTAHAMKEERERCLARGFTDHVSKPIDHHQLEQTLFHHTS